ncbi:MAG TPA: NADPH-dependent oxidoreductase [Ligilactobacillus acidipiscis]|uniref:NADPH-dependent oxidoreductase n=1 Tax=Ligilactobacillus acidipiscis TaxID=89059 RepID=A0A921K234_9LACO|nr:NADPH-dependent oxidoreductase [Ligilactobacillus acidipiscis]
MTEDEKELSQTITNQLNHKTIRSFKDKSVPKATLNKLLSVASHTATSHFLQSFSVISITDPKLRQQISQISEQKYINANGHLFIFIVDQYRAFSIARQETDQPLKLGSADKFFQGVSDSLLAAQNMINAAESLKLGTVALGSILNDALRLIKLLELPKLTFPILGLIVGYPQQEPQFKPRLPKEMWHFTNQYQTPTNFDSLLAEYDQTIKTYYETRDTNRREETFSSLVTKSALNTPKKRAEIGQAIRKQGFLNDLEI